VVRSLEAWESAHARAQYYLQVGHSFSPARRKEMPAIGAVIAYEMQARRKQTDFLPPFVAINFNNSQAGLVREGFLESKYGPLPLDLQQGNEFVIAAPEKQVHRQVKRRHFADRETVGYQRWLLATSNRDHPNGINTTNLTFTIGFTFSLLRVVRRSFIGHVVGRNRGALAAFPNRGRTISIEHCLQSVAIEEDAVPRIAHIALLPELIHIMSDNFTRGTDVS
jgi:Protein of unknown function (DUF1501)